MKKTFLASLMAIIATGSAQAYTFDLQESGTEVDFYGSLRVKWESTANKTNSTEGDVSREHINHAVDNNRSRFGLKLKQNLGKDFYALGRVEWRFRGDAASQHNFDHIYARQLYAGFGHKDYGELVYGNMKTIVDEVSQTDLANTYSLSDGLVDVDARRVLQYTYQGIEWLSLGVYYGGTSHRDYHTYALGDNYRKKTWGGAAIYEHEIDSLQGFTIAAGFTRNMFAKPDGAYHDRAYLLGLSYYFDRTTYGLDLAHQVIRNEESDGDKQVKNEITAVIRQGINDNWNIYTMYSYKTDKRKPAHAEREKETSREWTIGTEYYIYKQDSVEIKPFIEWQAIRTKYENNELARSRDFNTVIGLRAYW